MVDVTQAGRCYPDLLIMEKTCEGTAYSHLYYKRELRNYYVTIPVILTAEPAKVHDIGH